MSDGPKIHLTRDELAWLSEGEKISPTESAFAGDRSSLEAHAASCAVCANQLRAYREAHATLRNLVTSVGSKNTSVCPSEETWASLATGRLASGDSEAFIDHASACDYCGRLLREATEDLGQPLSDEEKRSISSLASATTKWQRDLAYRMASVEASSPTIRSERVSWKRFGRFRLGWAFATAVCVSAVVGVVIWTKSKPISSVDDLVAQSYSERRPFSLRLSNARFGVLHQQRGQLTASNDPQSLREAKVKIAKALLRNPQDSRWLQAKGDADLIDGHIEAALVSLQAASENAPKDTAILVDLAVAYFELPVEKAASNAVAEHNAQPRNPDMALRLLSQVLAANPRDAAALFNRALIYQSLGRNIEAETDFQRYLEIDPGSEWATEVRSRIFESQKP